MATALFLAVLFVHIRGNMGCADSMWSIPTAISLLDRHSPRLDGYQAVLAARNYNFIRYYNGHYYTMFPLGASVLAAPVVAILRPLARRAISTQPQLRDTLERYQEARGCPTVLAEPVIEFNSLTELLIASLIVAATTLLVFYLAGRHLSLRRAAIIAVVFAFGTSVWSTASRSLWQHGPSILMLTAALMVLTGNKSRKAFFMAGALLAFGYVCRPTSAIALAVLSAWVLWRHARSAAWYAGGVACVLVPFLFANHAWYGNWLPPYYWSERVGGSPYFWQALVGQLVSPSRGLFVFSPVLLFSIYGMWRRVREHHLTAFDMCLMTIILLHWLAIASFPHWWGGHSYGPRLFADMLPLFAYFLVPALQPPPSPSRHLWQALFVCTFTLTAMFSILVHAQGSLNPATMRWNMTPRNIDLDPSRLWDWSQPQFLAGLTGSG